MKDKIRLAKNQDTDRILELYNSSYFLWDKRSRDSEFTKKEIREYIKDKKSKMYVFEADGKIVGVLYAEFHSDYVYLNTIVVDKKYQGRGIGHILMNHLARESKKNKKTCIEAITERCDKPMQKIFKELNYGKGQTFIAFRRDL